MRMMLWAMTAVFFLTAWLCAAYTPVFTSHKDLKQVDTEFSNIEESVQAAQFTVFMATPILSELRDNEVVIISTNGWTAIMFRAGEDIFKVSVSCVTVRR